MADQDHDQEVSRRYRELGRDEPPPELDAAIRAAARRAAGARPAPLVAPTGRRRWYFPALSNADGAEVVAGSWTFDCRGLAVRARRLPIAFPIRISGKIWLGILQLSD